MFTRHKYTDKTPWTQVRNPVATRKYDGGHYFLTIEPDGSPRFFSRRESVRGGFPERTSQLPHLTDTKVPQYAGHTYSVELIHTGHYKHNIESHPALSGILNSLPAKAIATQQATGPVRAVLLDVINPPLPTYGDKMSHLKEVEGSFGKSDVLFAPDYHEGLPAIVKLIEHTKKVGQEGAIVTDKHADEATNPRVKVVHKLMFNLRITGVVQEKDINGKLKPQAGAYKIEDARHRDLGTVATGSNEESKEAWEHPELFVGKLIQVSCKNVTSAGLLRQPVLNGDADGDCDVVPVSR